MMMSMPSVVEDDEIRNSSQFNKQNASAIRSKFRRSNEIGLRPSVLGEMETVVDLLLDVAAASNIRHSHRITFNYFGIYPLRRTVRLTQTMCVSEYSFYFQSN